MNFAGKNRHQTTVTVIAWDVSRNQVGRAYMIAEALAPRFTVKILGFTFEEYGTEIWEPIKNGDIPIDVYPAQKMPDFFDQLDSIAATIQSEVIIACKPRLPSLLLGFLAKKHRNRPLILDIDDYELSFFKNLQKPSSLKDIVRPYSRPWTEFAESLISYVDEVFVSNAALQNKFGGTLIPHARDEEKFNPARHDKLERRAELGLPRDDKLVLFLGTPRQHKGLLELLTALKQCSNPSYKLCIMGDFPDSHLQNQLESLGQGQLILLPNQPFQDIPKNVKLADAVCLLQEADSLVSQYQLPAKAIDAIAMGVPVLAFRTPPLEPLIQQNMIIPTDPDNLARDLDRVLGDTEPFQKSLLAKRAIFLEQYSYRAIAHKMEQVIRGCIDDQPEPVPARALAFMEIYSTLFRENNRLLEKERAEKQKINMRNQELNDQNRELKEKLTSLQKKLQEIDKQRKRLNQQYNQVINSRTWRLTAPARKTADQIKKVIRSKPKPGKGPGAKDNQTTTEQNIEPREVKPESNVLELLQQAKPYNLEMLKKEYLEKELDQQPDHFILYRIIGNDLYPRHKKGQSRENLRFILENEMDFEDCEKCFVVNRLMDPEEETAIIDLLHMHHKPYLHLPFDPEVYRSIGWDTECYPFPGYLASRAFEHLGEQQQARAIGAAYRLKNNYVMHNNGARNSALKDGRGHAKWVLPWDGNCFITDSAWEQIKADVKALPYMKYFIVPMTRVLDNKQLLSKEFLPDPVEEPQIIFRADAGELFNEDYCYGRRPKVELFWRLGVPGPWDQWKDDPWDQKRPTLSPEARQFAVAGWVARLFSGMEKLEQDSQDSFKQRGRIRLQATVTTLQHLDARVSGASAKRLTSFRETVLEQEIQAYKTGSDKALTELVNQLVAEAEEALRSGPYSVIDKKTLPPSGNKNDYWHPAPYWWPNPNTPDGLPYIQRDGERVPGTRLYEPESEKYDRTRLQRVFDDSTILALAWKFTGETRYARHGADILERFFVDPQTAMTPHLEYAQVRMGHNNNLGTNHGIIEMKDLYYYLDAVRLFLAAGIITDVIIQQFEKWLSTYLDWLLNSPQGKKERIAANNHGTYYDLQVASIAAFLDERPAVYEALLRAQSRLAQQFAPDGSQPQELARKTTAHYCCFNFQGWINLAEIASRWGEDFWSYRTKDGAGLSQGARWLLAHTGQKWPYQQLDEFDYQRFHPPWFMIPGTLENISHSGAKDGGEPVPGSRYQVKPRFFPHDGIRPYWNLG